MSGICSLSDRQSGPIDRTPVTPGSDNNRNILKKYEVNYMNLEQGAATSNKEPEKAWPSLHVTENKKDEERRSNFSERCQRESSNVRLIEYCEEEDEECNEAVSGKLAIHLNTGETNREFCINRVDDAHSRRSQTREESVTCGSELEKPLFIKKYQGRFFQTDVETSSDRASSDNEAPPVPPPRSKSKESSVVVVGGQKTDRCCSLGLECNLIYDSVVIDQPDKVMEATSSTRATDARLPSSAATSAALNRSRSRSRVSEYDAYTRQEPTDSVTTVVLK